MNVLQTLVFPNLEVCSEEALYLRPDARAWCPLADGGVRFEAGGTVSTDTFHNGLTVEVWKREADIRSLVLALDGAGEFVLTLGLHRRGLASVWLAEHRVTLVPGQRVHLPVAAWEGLSSGLLFWRLRALGPGRLAGAAWLTADEPLREVRLGLVVTHFNRVAQVLPAIARIRRFIASRADLRGRLTLTVVDNSRNLPVDSDADGPLTVIPNRNLGGTGGFVRGLLSLIDGGTHTHALFMDDDASCETEAIARTVALLAHARDERLAVAGALQREAAPWMLIEKGARFDGRVRPLHDGLDLRDVGQLLEAETQPQRPDYGAWWFFAFPIAQVMRFPFPFFVRGDDIEFGLANRFRVTTLNGVSCLGDDFGLKHGPLTAYLDARYHLVLALLSGREAASRIAWVATRLFAKALCGYQYASAKAVTTALRHVAHGPEFFRTHLDMAAVRAEIGRWQPDEKLRPLAREALALRGPRRRREGPLRRLARLVTLQGFLLPGALIKDRTTVQDKQFHGPASGVFRYRRVLYEHAPSGTGFVAEYDRRRFFAELRAFLPAWWAVMRRLDALRDDYRRGADELGSIGFWRSVYAQPEPPAAAPAPQESRPAAV